MNSLVAHGDDAAAAADDDDDAVVTKKENDRVLVISQFSLHSFEDENHLTNQCLFTHQASSHLSEVFFDHPYCIDIILKDLTTSSVISDFLKMEPHMMLF